MSYPCRILWVLLALFGSIAAQLHAAVTVTESVHKDKGRQVQYEIATGTRTFILGYRHASDAQGAFAPLNADPDASSGLHLDAVDCLGNWFWNGDGFFKVLVNGKNVLRTSQARFTVVASDGRKGIIDAIWDTPAGVITARFVARDGEDRLFVEVSVDGPQAVESLSLGLVAYPHYVANPREPGDQSFQQACYVATPGQVVHTPDGAVDLPRDESWLFYYNTKITGFGPCAALFDQSALGALHLQMHGNRVTTTADCLPGARKFRFLLWEYPGAVAWASALERFKTELAPEAKQALAKEDFAPPAKQQIIAPLEVKSQQSGTTYGLDDIILENEAIRVVIAPYAGGRIRSFLYKPTGSECARWQVPEWENRCGMLRDISPCDPHSWELGERPYAYEVVKRQGSEIAVAVSLDNNGFRYRKQLSLRAGEAVLRVALSRENIGYGLAPMDWRIHNVVTPPVPEGLKDARYWVPTTAGVIDANGFVENLASNWLAVTAAGGGGIGAAFNYHQVAKALVWKGGGMEWLYAPDTLEPGCVWRSEFFYAPFEKLDRVSLVTDKAVIAISAVGDRVILDHVGLATGTLDARLLVRNAAGDRVLFDAPVRIPVALGKRDRTTCEVPGLAASAAILRLEATCGSLLCAGETANFSAPKPAFAKPARTPPPILAQAVAKTAIRQETKAAADDGRIRVLMLSPWTSVRGNSGLKPDDWVARTVFRAREGITYWLRNDPRFAIDAVDETNWLDALARLYTYDVLVVNDFPGLALAPYAEDLLAYVESGHGLVILGGYHAYGSRGTGYANYRKLQALLPVELTATPDWIEQAPAYQGVDPQPIPGNPDGRIATCQTCGVRQMKFCAENYLIPPGADDAWIRDGKPLVAQAPGHPVIAGIPLASLAPAYHAVTAKAGAEIVATVAGSPAIVGMPRGTGRILASMISDLPRLYFWPHTAQLTGQMLLWAAGKAPPVRCAAAGSATGEVTVSLANDADAIARPELHVTVQGPDNRIYATEHQVIELPAHGRIDRSIPLPADRLPAGRYRIQASVPGHAATGYVDIARPSACTITAAFAHRRRFVRGEAIAPPLTLAGTDRQDVQLSAELVDEAGVVTATAPPLSAVPGQAAALPISTANVAYGPYRYNVLARDAAGQVLGRDSQWVFVARLAPADFFVGWYGSGGLGGGSSLIDIATLDLMAESTNLIFGPKIFKEHAADVMDYGLQAGMRCMPFTWSMLNSNQIWAKADPSARHPDKIETSARLLREVLLRYRDFPAISTIYLGDEERSLSRSPYDQQEFAKRFGRPFPAAPRTAEEERIYLHTTDLYARAGQLPDSPEERVMLADYQIESLRLSYRRGQEVVKSVRPDWLAAMLTQPCGECTPACGVWPEESSRDLDAILMDVYPDSVVEVGQSLFHLNAIRAAARRQHTPGWVVLGEYRNDLESSRMQFWIALLTDMKGILWFSLHPWETALTGIRSRKFQSLSICNALARDHAPLLTRWTKPPSRVAALYSKATAAKIYYRPRALEKAFVALYGHDVMADPVTETQVRDGTLRQYDALVLAGIDTLEQDVIAGLADYARTHAVYADAETTVAIPGARPFDAAAIRQSVVPLVETPDETVYGDMLTAAGMHYVVLYNHSGTATTATPFTVHAPQATTVYDLRRHVAVPARSTPDGVTAEVPLDAYDGTILAILPAAITGVSIGLDQPSAAQGATVRATVKLSPAIPGLIPIRVTVLAPDGRKTSYSQDAVLDNGSYAMTLNLAVNDMPGAWTVIAEEQVSGTSGRAVFTVTKKP